MAQTFNDLIKNYCGLDPTDDSYDAIFSSSLASSLLKISQQSSTFTVPDKKVTLETTLDSLGFTDPFSPYPEFICINAQLAFDPPTSAQVMNAYKDELAELSFRMSVM